MGMKYILTLEDFSYKIDFDDPHRIQWLKLDPIEIQMDSKKVKDLTRYVLDNLFDIYFFNDKEIQNTLKRKLSDKRPTLKYGLTKDVRNYIESFDNFDTNSVYNFDKENTKKSGNKKIWHQILKDKDYVPKTVFSKVDANNLDFPIIAKPAKGHSGLGIKIFKDHKELMSNRSKFDTYSEVVDFVSEYRAIFVKGKPVVVLERIPNQKKNKTVVNKGMNEQVSFVYVEQDMDKFPYLDKIEKISFDFRKSIPLDVYSLDFFIDKNDKIWIIESNAATGLGALTLAKVYLGMYRDFFKKDPPSEKMTIIKKIEKEYNEEIKNKFPKEYDLSKYPL